MGRVIGGFYQGEKSGDLHNIPDRGYPHRIHTHPDGNNLRRNPLLDREDTEARNTLLDLAEDGVLKARNRVLNGDQPARRYLLPVKE